MFISDVSFLRLTTFPDSGTTPVNLWLTVNPYKDWNVIVLDFIGVVLFRTFFPLPNLLEPRTKPTSRTRRRASGTRKLLIEKEGPKGVPIEGGEVTIDVDGGVKPDNLVFGNSRGLRGATMGD